MPPSDTVEDHVVLLAEDGTPVGTAPRADVHTQDTPLHLAFSCWLHRADGAVLVTRRALSKRTFPGVWTNSFCGHPRVGESLEHAVRRHGIHELGLEVERITPVVPDFRYRALDASGILENEICPVFDAWTQHEPAPHPGEVMDLRWVSVDRLHRAIDETPWAFSPWLVEQSHARRGLLLTGSRS